MEQRMCLLWMVKQCLQCWSGYEWRGASDCVVLMKPETYLSKYHNCKWGRSEVDSGGQLRWPLSRTVLACLHPLSADDNNAQSWLSHRWMISSSDILLEIWIINATTTAHTFPSNQRYRSCYVLPLATLMPIQPSIPRRRGNKGEINTAL